MSRKVPRSTKVSNHRILSLHRLQSRPHLIIKLTLSPFSLLSYFITLLKRTKREPDIVSSLCSYGKILVRRSMTLKWDGFYGPKNVGPLSSWLYVGIQDQTTENKKPLMLPSHLESLFWNINKMIWKAGQNTTE